MGTSDAHEAGIGLARGRVRRQLAVRDTLSATTIGPGLELGRSELEQRLVVVLPRVEEHEVERAVELSSDTNASPGITSIHSSSPASAMFRADASSLTRLRLERGHMAAVQSLTAAPSQIVE